MTTRVIIGRLREHFGAGDLFGREKDQSLSASLEGVFQTFGGKDLYPSIEEKAANLLYLPREEPFRHRRQQTDRGGAVSLVPGEE